MEKTYLLWHGQRSGWVASTGTSTDREQALKFTREEALKRCERNKDHTGAHVVLPINEADLI